MQSPSGYAPVWHKTADNEIGMDGIKKAHEMDVMPTCVSSG
jgi:hypothetical protein